MFLVLVEERMQTSGGESVGEEQTGQPEPDAKPNFDQGSPPGTNPSEKTN
jgi:hypothetical protein